MPSTANFVLPAFESSFTMDLSGVITVLNPLPTLDVSANATIHVDLSAMRDIFTYHTDSADVVNAAETDLLFYVNSSNSTGFGSDVLINPVNALVDTNPIYNESVRSKRLVCHDFIRYLAQKLFSTHYGTDLFENEQELLNSLRTLSNNDSGSGHVWDNIISVANTAAAASPSQYSVSNSNICCQIFRQMITQFPGRFSDISSDCVDATPTASSQYYIPFHENDTLQFKLSITPATGQEALTGVSAFGARTYSITLLMKDAANIDNPAVSDDPLFLSIINN